ncbi:hypothetical protein NCH01_09520 [Neoasaia chiangmaiensis]|nr:hypothetical protein NCH01_09520 [Neoasaia chiangmaiensis]
MAQFVPRLTGLIPVSPLSGEAAMKQLSQSIQDRADARHVVANDAPVTHHTSQFRDEPFRVQVELHGPEWHEPF